jgi:hypothetical protein
MDVWKEIIKPPREKKNIDFCGRSTHTPLQAPAEEHANVEKEHAEQTVQQVEMYVNISDHSGQVQ